ncbi:hypothetical protein CYMTET_9958 [Cymbomonas tetramitiformis]|uniref:Uncharacterized protein n=1 Tax=Cymbomonas tetramitiformis TaxID=36881 RepID=A0AAE0LEI0_9CHLO|nr:hypothetical protein CYMTET_9958 [Cymbomonas tetramitiformis]
MQEPPERLRGAQLREEGFAKAHTLRGKVQVAQCGSVRGEPPPARPGDDMGWGVDSLTQAGHTIWMGGGGGRHCGRPARKEYCGCEVDEKGGASPERAMQLAGPTRVVALLMATEQGPGLLTS